MNSPVFIYNKISVRSAKDNVFVYKRMPAEVCLSDSILQD